MTSDNETPRQTSVVRPVKSATRVMEILELFAREQRPLSLAEIGGHLGYPTASTSALLKSLQAIDYLSFDRLSRNYSPTIRVAMLGDWVRADVLRNGLVVEVMRDLALRLHATIYLGMQNDLQAQYIHTEQPGRMRQYYVAPGRLRSLTDSAAGIMLLACQSDAQINRLITRLASMQPDTLDSQRVWSRIEAARENGFACNTGLTSGVSAAAVPLPFRANGRPLVLCLGTSEKRFQDETGVLTEELRKAAAGLA